jgi:hypothetical protein
LSQDTHCVGESYGVPKYLDTNVDSAGELLDGGHQRSKG